MFDRFTDRARKLMGCARQEAVRLRHDHIGTEHLLLGLVEEGTSIAASVLKELGLDLDGLRAEVEKLVAKGSTGRLDWAPFGPVVRRALDYAEHEGHHEYAGTEHILLGLLRNRHCIAAQALTSLGIRLDEVRREVMDRARMAMVYLTEFLGEFKLSRPLTKEHRAYLLKFSETRRTKRDARTTERLPDPVREAVGLPVGSDGAYYVGSHALGSREQTSEFDRKGRRKPTDVVSLNEPPAGQPNLWCHWVPNRYGTAIVWDGCEKFFMYAEWLEYLVEHFLKPWGYVLNGEVAWFGEDMEDFGSVTVTENEIDIAGGMEGLSSC